VYQLNVNYETQASPSRYNTPANAYTPTDKRIEQGKWRTEKGNERDKKGILIGIYI